MKKEKLQKGQDAPNIQTHTIFEKTVNLSAITSHKIWLAFYRYATCPLCEIHFDDVLTRSNQLKKWGIHFIAVFESEVENFPKRVQGVDEEGFNIIADPNKFLYDAYRIETSWPKVFHPESVVQSVKAYKKGFKNPKMDGNIATIPAHFLIAPGGKIYEAHYGRSAGHHLVGI